MGVGKLRQVVRQLAGTDVASLDATGKVPVSELPVMVGATGIADGTAGIVPKPLAGEQGEFLQGDATFATP